MSVQHPRAAAILFLLLIPAAFAPAQSPEAVDVVPFGQPMTWNTNGTDAGVMWEDARDIFRVGVTFEAGAAPPKADSLHLEYWQSQWPHRRIPRTEPSGAGGAGWLDVGDWYNGKWQVADADVRADGSTFTFTFKPLNAKEFPKLTDFPATYRSTLKLRLVGAAALPKIARLEAFTDSTWKPLTVEVLWGGNAREAQTWDGKIEVFNGRLDGLEELGADGSVAVTTHGWKSTVQGRTAGVRARIGYAEPKAYNSFDQTVVTIRAAQETFSFAALDLMKAGRIFIPDYGVLVRKAGDSTDYAAAEKAWQQRRSRASGRDLYSRVFSAPEQTFAQSWNDTPSKNPQYIPMSFEGSRQHFRLDPNGDVHCSTGWIDRIKGKDTDRCHWSGRHIHFSMGMPGVRPTDRHLLDGYLPIMISQWEQGGVRYRQIAFAVPLHGVPSAGARLWADDTLVLMTRLEMQRVGAGDVPARLELGVDHKAKETLTVRDDLVLVAEDEPQYLRMRITSPDARADYALSATEAGLTYEAKLTDASPTRTLELAIPFITLAEPREYAILRQLQFDEQLSAVGGYWRRRISEGCQIQTPEPMVNDFYRADAAHLLINTEREVGVSDRYMPKVGTFSYGVYANESAMMLDDLEVRGYPQLVERALEGWLHYQGTVPLPGDFTSADGVFYGDGGYEAGEYNQHHGWVLWMLGEHYWFTRDRDWLTRAAPKIVKGCDWVTEQRRHTSEIAARTPIRAIERGLMPPGRLEDIGDWRTWLSTNVYTWWGCQNAARALADINHPEAARLLQDARQYHDDLLAAYAEAMRRSPVVPLRDGCWIPKVPSDVHRRGRWFGWITETLEGSLHLIRTGAIPPDSRLATWIVKDYEDNLYLSEQFGYDLKGPTFERFWFSLGGISMQANLLHNPFVYLLRDEPQHFVRAYFNAFSVSYFPDTRMMTEHALPNIGDWRGDHFKSSDESNSTYWLRCMFVQERGDELLLGYALPRYWLADGQRISIANTHTHFGPMSLTLTSSADEGSIEMAVTPPTRNPPKLIRARFRHPQGLRMTGCEVNGKPYARFDPQTETVELPGAPGEVHIVARYGGANPKP